MQDGDQTEEDGTHDALALRLAGILKTMVHQNMLTPKGANDLDREMSRVRGDLRAMLSTRKNPQRLPETWRTPASVAKRKAKQIVPVKHS